MDKRLGKSSEDYLETILLLGKDKAGVHAIDVAGALGFSKPSVTRALGILKADGLVEIDDERHVRLTASGRARAEQIYERHTLIAKFLVGLGVSEKTADKDACQIEHIISDETFEVIKNFCAKS